ncbi:MAG: hypothetical protein WA364_07300 [Candidatus Nitrosopolaris sp.]
MTLQSEMGEVSRSTNKQFNFSHNIAGVPITIADQQRRNGSRSDVFVFNKVAHKLFGRNKINYRSFISRWKFLKKLKDYDIWHYHIWIIKE